MSEMGEVVVVRGAPKAADVLARLPVAVRDKCHVIVMSRRAGLASVRVTLYAKGSRNAGRGDDIRR